MQEQRPSRFIALHCGEETSELLRHHPNAFLLLAQIAMRAKWKDDPVTGLKAGQALIGDYQNAGIATRKAYRHAQKILLDCGFGAFKGANKGTIATLTDQRIFSITADSGAIKRAIEGPSRGHQGATNHTDTQNTQNTQNTQTSFVPDWQSHPPQGQEVTPTRVTQRREISLEGNQFASWFKSSLPPEINLQANWHQKFAEAYDDLVRLDKRADQDIRDVCLWARNDPFWQSNFYSPAKLRTRNKDGISYFEVFRERMKSATRQTTPTRSAGQYPEPPTPKIKLL